MHKYKSTRISTMAGRSKRICKISYRCYTDRNNQNGCGFVMLKCKLLAETPNKNVQNHYYKSYSNILDIYQLKPTTRMTPFCQENNLEEFETGKAEAHKMKK